MLFLTFLHLLCTYYQMTRTIHICPASLRIDFFMHCPVPVYFYVLIEKLYDISAFHGSVIDIYFVCCIISQNLVPHVVGTFPLKGNRFCQV